MVITDETIVNRFFDRNEQALSDVQEKYEAYLKTVAKNILGSDLDAEECVNDTYMKAWDSIPPNRPENLKAYLSKITRNLSFNLYQKAHAGKRGGGETALVLDELEGCVPGNYDPEEEITKQELASEINAFLSGLPKENRMLFVSRYYYADSVSEIAKRFRLSENTVSVRLNRLRARLKKHLTERGYV